MPSPLQRRAWPHVGACVLVAASLLGCADRATPTPPGEASGAPSAEAPIPANGMSRQDDCRGPAELCKQDSAK
ncbi:hypothetical protein [Ramlibacter algicola]|uniref:Lipoprotein n=1 Tax=Ramlibacter algicola TaxID=2795217 RepID=A0A934UPF9_9BURK|nr:hypothetical protein [Ramlibacter algicola]MBK0391030.1 hypothetical protein [Ramlibacter algicola]